MKTAKREASPQGETTARDEGDLVWQELGAWRNHLASRFANRTKEVRPPSGLITEGLTPLPKLKLQNAP